MYLNKQVNISIDPNQKEEESNSCQERKTQLNTITAILNHVLNSKLYDTNLQ